MNKIYGYDFVCVTTKQVFDIIAGNLY